MTRSRTDDAAPRVLVADDQSDVLAALRLLLRGAGFEVETFGSPAAVLEAVRTRTYDAALIDLNYARDTTSGQEGLELLSRLRALDAHLPVIVMTAWATIEVAVEAMRRGARDFLEKPWDNHRVLAIVRNQVSLARELRHAAKLEAENELLQAPADPGLVVESDSMRAALDVVRRVAASDAAVLITGENGTGKGVLARELHRLSDRAEGPFIAVNMGAIPESLFESEMLGHVRGAFTDARSDRVGRFELADGGTLFLDEIGNVPLSQQAKLLRVIESGEFERVGSSRTQRTRVRLVCATNADLGQAVREGRFRQDLLFRINTIEIRVPPLRERPEDILPLAARRLVECARKYGRSIEGFEPVAERALRSWSWPGNVRELNNVIERAVLMASSHTLTTADLRLTDAAALSAAVTNALEDMSLEDAERVLIRAALRRAAGNVNAAAESLGLSRSAMYRRLDKLGIKAP